MTDQVNHTFIGTLTDHKTHANNTLEATFRVPRGGLVWEVNEDGSLGPRRKQQAGPIDWGALGLEVGPLNPKTPSLTLAHTEGNGEMAGYYLKSMGKTGPNLVTMHLHPLRSDDPVCIGLVKGRRYVCCLDATPAPPTTCERADRSWRRCVQKCGGRRNSVYSTRCTRSWDRPALPHENPSKFDQDMVNGHRRHGTTRLAGHPMEEWG